MAKGDNLGSSELISALNQVSSAINSSPSNIYINPSVLKDILALDKELSSVLNDLNLTNHDRSRQLLQQHASRSNGILAMKSPKTGEASRICSSYSMSENEPKPPPSNFSAEDSKSSTSISLYSTDSVISQISAEDQDKKKKLVIRCNYNSENLPVSNNLLHVFRHNSSSRTPPPPCPDSCCENNLLFKCRSKRDMDKKTGSESNACSRSRRKEDKRERTEEEKNRQNMKRQCEREEQMKLRREKQKRKMERARERRERKMERRKLEREMRKKAREEEREIREREQEEERYRRRIECEERRDRKHKDRDEENERKYNALKIEEERKERRYEEKKKEEREREGKKEKMKRDQKEYCECDPRETLGEKEPETKGPDSEESIISTDSCDPLNACKTGVQCEISCTCPKCVSCCKSSQGTNTRKISSHCKDPPSRLMRSRIAKFLSSFTHGDHQLRLPPPEKTCRSTKSTITPKCRLPRTVKIDSSCGPSRVIDSCCGPPKVNIPAPKEPPKKSPPCEPQPSQEPTKCEPYCKLPRCRRAPSFPRLTPRLTPPCRFKPTCRMQRPREPRTRTPSPPCILKPSNPRQHTPPPRFSRPTGPFFSPKSEAGRTRPSVCFEPQLRENICAPPPQPADTQRVCEATPDEPKACANIIDKCVPPPCSSRPLTPQTPSKLTQCPSQSHIPPDSSTSPPCSPAACDLRPYTPTSPPPNCPKPFSHQPCGKESVPPSNAQPCHPKTDISENNSHSRPSKPCELEPQQNDTFAPYPICPGSYRQQPPKCDSHCNIKKWSCCTKRTRHSGLCSPSSHSRVSILGPASHSNPLRKRHNPYLIGCSDSDFCHPGSCASRRCSPSSIYSWEDTCYKKRKCNKPWWAPKSPSSYSFGGCSECGRRCDMRKYWDPYCLDEGYCYAEKYPVPPWYSYHPLDGPYCPMDMCCHIGHHLPGPPKECVSIPCTPGGPRSYSLPHKAYSCTPPSGRIPNGDPHLCTSSCRPPSSPLFPPHQCPPPGLPYPAHFSPPYPPPFLHCQSPCPPPCYPLTYPFCPDSPCSLKPSVSSCDPELVEKTCEVSKTGPKSCNQAPLPQKPKFFKEPSFLKKFSKCSGRHGMKNPPFPKSGCRIPVCPPKPRNFIPSRPLSPCGSQIPSYGNLGYPTPSHSSCGPNYWPYAPTSLTNQPYDYWPNQYPGYDEYPPCPRSRAYNGPGVSPLRSKLNLSKLKCSKLYRMSCESGFPKYDNSSSSSVSSYSSCSSSRSSLSSSESTYTSHSSSSCSSSSRTSPPSYCVASCRNSSSNLFKCTPSRSSIFSSNDCLPKRTICDEIGRCHSNRQTCGSTFPCNPPPPEAKTHQQGPPLTRRVPLHCARSQVCSSATELQNGFRVQFKGVDHYDERIRFELKKIGMDQLLQASKPAKCCKQTVLNQPSREELPYAASLASLPLDRTDIRVIRQSVRMATNKTNCNYTSLENRNKLVYYANLVSDDFEMGKPKVPPEYEVRYFSFALEDAENCQNSLRKNYKKPSMFRFFQIFNWQEKSSVQELKVCSSSQKLDLTTSLDCKKFITPTDCNNEIFGCCTRGMSTDSLENIVFSDLLLGYQSGVGDSKAGNSLDENYPIEILLNQARKKNHNLNMNFTMTETSLETDTLFEYIRNRRGMLTGRLDSIPNKKVNASSQTVIGQSFFHNLRNTNVADVASQTDDNARYLKIGDMTFSEEMRKLLSDGDSVEYLKRNTNRLIFTSEDAESESLVHLKLGTFESKSETIQITKGSEFENASENFGAVLEEFLEEIQELNGMAESFKIKSLNSSNFMSETRDFTMKSTICSTYSSKPPFNECKLSLVKDTDGRASCIGVIDKNAQPERRNSFCKQRKQISKGQFIVSMYNSINDIISEIYVEAEKLATLRKNRMARSEVRRRVGFPGKNRKKTSMRSEIGKISNGETEKIAEILADNALTEDPSYSMQKLRSVYTSAGKIITKFYNAKGKEVKSIYNMEGEQVADSCSANKLAKVLFDNTGNFISGYCDSHGNILKAVYDSQRKLLRKTFNSKMLLITFPSEGRMQKSKRIFNSQGFPVYRLYSGDEKLLTSMYDFEGTLVRGTFLGNIAQLYPRIFDKTGKFILGRYDRDGVMINRIFDAHGNNLQQLYKADQTNLHKLPVRLKIVNGNGEPVKKFYKKDQTPLTHVYDVLGNLLAQASDGNSKDLLCRLFDLDGFFILGRLDELRHLIEAVYDENGNKICQVRVLDSEIGDTIKMSKLYSFKGNLLVNFYEETGVYLKNVHDAEGAIVASSPSGRAVKLAGRMFDIAGYFIQGRYDDERNLIREIYDHEGYKIFRVYDVAGSPISKLPQSNKIFDSKGRQISHIYRSDHRIISSIYDVSGEMIGGVLSIEAEELAPFLFDMEGRFINSRYDSQMKIIEHVYDSRDNLLDRVYTQDSLIPKCSKKPRPLKTVYVKFDFNEKDYFNASCSNAFTTFDGHCQTLPKILLPPITMSRISNKSSKFETLPSRKRKRGEKEFEEGRLLVSVKCQCRIPRKKVNKQRTSTPAAKCDNKKLNESVTRRAAYQHPAKRKKVEKSAKKDTMKSENMDKSKAGTQHKNERPYKISVQNSQSGPNNVTTVMPCYEAIRSETQMNPDSLESLLDDYLQHEQRSHIARERKGENMKLNSEFTAEIKEASNRKDNSNQEIEESTTATTFSDSTSGTTSTEMTENATEDAFLCNIPNAPPFILKMHKVQPASVATESQPEQMDKLESYSSLSSTSTDFDVEDISSSSTSVLEKKGPYYAEIADLNMYIDDNCPGFENKEFKKFVAKSITWIKAEGVKRSIRPRGLFMSTPTICMTGLTSISNNPFGMDDIDSRRTGKNNGSFQNTDVLYKKNSFHYHSKIPRMLHPGKCKVHCKMKNVQLSPGSKGCAANKASTCSGPCPSDKMEVQINPYVKVSVSTTCPSLTNASPNGNIKGGVKQGNPGSKSKNANVQASQSSMGDCMKGIKSDPGCYCGNDPVETTECPIRLREDCECVEDEAAAQTAEPEEEDPLCYCPPGEQPLLMKKSNIECDCANRRRCEDQTLVEPPKEKPDVFWALTKVSLLKDGTKNFEIIDVSPVPPGYYLMPDVNNLVLVGPQPKPAKATPSKNCSCK